MVQLHYLDVWALRYTKLMSDLVSDRSTHCEAWSILATGIDSHDVGFPRHPRGPVFLSPNLPLVLGNPGLLLGGIWLMLSSKNGYVCTALRLTRPHILVRSRAPPIRLLLHVPYKYRFGVTNIGTVELIVLYDDHCQG